MEGGGANLVFFAGCLADQLRMVSYLRIWGPAKENLPRGNFQAEQRPNIFAPLPRALLAIRAVRFSRSQKEARFLHFRELLLIHF